MSNVLCLVSVLSNSLYSMDCSPLGSSVHGIFPSRILDWLPLLTQRDIPNPGIEFTSPASPALAGKFFTTNTT